MCSMFKPYLALVKSKRIFMVSYSLNVVLALVASSRINGSDLATFGKNLLLFSMIVIIYVVVVVLTFYLESVTPLVPALICRFYCIYIHWCRTVRWM